MLLVALTAVGASAAHAQSAVAPTAPATPTQIYNYLVAVLPSAVANGRRPAAQPRRRRARSERQCRSVSAARIPTEQITWYPSVTGATFYDDNVFARHTNRQGDWAGVVRPELAWRANNLPNVEVGRQLLRRAALVQPLQQRRSAQRRRPIGSTVRAGENTQFITRLQYLHGHEDRGTSDSINTAFLRPLQYDQVEAAGAINQRYGRFWTSVGAVGAFVHFGSGTLAGIQVPQDYRIGTISSVPVRLGYVVAPLTSVFVEASANHRDFQVGAFDSHGYRVVGGALFEPGPGSRIKGEIYGGYMNQNYSGFGFQTVSTFTYGSSLAFLLTPTLTAVLEGRRDAREASLSGGVACRDARRRRQRGRIRGRRPHGLGGAAELRARRRRRLPAGRVSRRRPHRPRREPAGLGEILRQPLPDARLRLPLSQLRFERARRAGLLPQRLSVLGQREDVAAAHIEAKSKTGPA